MVLETSDRGQRTPAQMLPGHAQLGWPCSHVSSHLDQAGPKPGASLSQLVLGDRDGTTKGREEFGLNTDAPEWAPGLPREGRLDEQLEPKEKLSLAVPQKVTHGITIRPRTCPKDLKPHVHSTFIHNNQDGDTTQVSSN